MGTLFLSKKKGFFYWLAFVVFMLTAVTDSGSVSPSAQAMSIPEISFEQVHSDYCHHPLTESDESLAASRLNLVECRHNETSPRSFSGACLASYEFRSVNKPADLISYLEPAPRRKCTALRLHLLSRLHILPFSESSFSKEPYPGSDPIPHPSLSGDECGRQRREGVQGADSAPPHPWRRSPNRVPRPM